MTSFSWGILGAARIAETLVPAIREAGGVVSALGERDVARPRAREFAARWDVPLVGGYQDVLDSDVDAVYIPLPNHLHHPWTLAALRAGKHVLTEKPFTLNAAEAQDLATAAHETGLTVAEAFTSRFHPYLQRVRAIVQSGELGEVRAMSGAFGFNLPPGTDIRWNASMGGGALYDLGSYVVCAARFLLGEPQAVSAHARWTPGGVDIGFSGTLDYPDASVGVECGFDWAVRAPQRLRIIGTAGTLECDRVSGGPTTAPTRLRIELLSSRRDEEIDPANAYVSMVAHVQRAARGEETLPYPPDDAVRQMRVLDALYASARAGQRVKISAQTV